MTRKKIPPISELIDLSGKCVIITGGAMGIGFAISFRFAEAGAAVVIADINDKEARDSCQFLKEAGYSAIPIHCDVGSEEDVKNMLSATASKMGGVDILVNNAGIYPRIPLAQMTGDDFDRVIGVNLKGVFLCSREASQQMIERGKGGCIINMASIDAVHPSAKSFSAYDASKGGVLTVTKSLALELGQYYIRVNAIAPGVILTEGTMSKMKGSAIEQDRAQLKSFMSRMVLGRMGKPDDIARVALFLASDLASYITGSVIFVDGGYLIS